MKRENIENCECTVIHQDKIDKVKKTMPDEEILYDLAEVFKVFGDSTRIKIMYSLFKSEMCVCDIAVLVGTTRVSNISSIKNIKTS